MSDLVTRLQGLENRLQDIPRRLGVPTYQHTVEYLRITQNPSNPLIETAEWIVVTQCWVKTLDARYVAFLTGSTGVTFSTDDVTLYLNRVSIPPIQLKDGTIRQFRITWQDGQVLTYNIWSLDENDPLRFRIILKCEMDSRG
jgi:hypothetical protein